VRSREFAAPGPLAAVPLRRAQRAFHIFDRIVRREADSLVELLHLPRMLRNIHSRLRRSQGEVVRAEVLRRRATSKIFELISAKGLIRLIRQGWFSGRTAKALDEDCGLADELIRPARWLIRIPIFATNNSAICSGLQLSNLGNPATKNGTGDYRKGIHPPDDCFPGFKWVSSWL
jgi:hypothetical protein